MVTIDGARHPVYVGDAKRPIYIGDQQIYGMVEATPVDPDDWGPSYFTPRPGATALGPIGHYTGGATEEGFYNHWPYSRPLSYGTEHVGWTFSTTLLTYIRIALATGDVPRWIDIRWASSIAAIAAITDSDTYLYFQTPPSAQLEQVVLRLQGAQLNRRRNDQIRFRGEGQDAIIPESGNLAAFAQHASGGGQFLVAFQQD